MIIIDQNNGEQGEISRGIWILLLILFTTGRYISLPCKLFNKSTVVSLSAVVLVCISVVAPLDVVDSVIVEISVETINVKKAVSVTLTFGI